MNEENCKFLENRKCIVTGRSCILADPLVCEYLHKAYELGRQHGYKEADAMNYFEGSGIGGFHEY